MRIRIADIPAEGRELEFTVPQESLNKRVAESNVNSRNSAVSPPAYTFGPEAEAQLHLEREGSTVVVKGRALGRYSTQCSRCAEDTSCDLAVEVDILLKPRPNGGPLGSADEDLNFGYYDDKEVDCAAVIEEFLVLSVPYSVLCDEQCAGLCSSCGVNLNNDSCSCAEAEMEPSEGLDERFAALRALKISN